MRVPKKIHHVTFRLQEIDKVFDLIEQNREKLINGVLLFNKERGKIPITKQEAEEILKQVLAYSKSRNLDPVLVLAVIWQESGFSPKVRNGPNYGLMQINRPAHLRNLIAAGIKTKQELLDIANNVSFGTAILDDCLHRYGLRDGIAAYNGGPKKRHYESTQNYAKEVMMRYHTMIDILSH
ncbi:MAG: lytic transglycosylase domain-containing protein [Candidatus Micrarchaeota archaeon]|nr:lytic transglycosylase domain-containing protein [Candidatus Micrarchaeota archaeon]